MATSYKGITVPEYTDPADGPGAFRSAVDSGPIPRFANESERNNANPSPVLGALVFVASSEQFEWWNGSNWEALAADVAPLTHYHTGAAITSGTIDKDRLPNATTSVKGAVRLTNSTTSTSQGIAATALAAKTAYDIGDHAHPYAAASHAHSYLPLGGGTMTGAITGIAGSTAATGLRFGTMKVNDGLYGSENELSVSMDGSRLFSVWDPTEAESRGSGVIEMRGTASASFLLSGSHGGYSFKLTAKALAWLADNHN